MPASSGTAGLTITRDQLITESYKKLRVVPEGGTASATQISDATLRLNLIIKRWQSKGCLIWTYYQVTVPNVAADTAYTIGPFGAQITTHRPLRIAPEGNYIRQTINGQPLDTPVRVISRAEYLQFGNKTSPGVINSIYYDSQFNLVAGATSPSAGYGTLYVYVAPQDATRTLYLNAQRPLFDMVNGTDEFDLPNEAMLALMYELAYELADDNEVPEDRIMRLGQQAKMYVEDLFDWSVETASMSFAPDYSSYGRR